MKLIFTHIEYARWADDVVIRAYFDTVGHDLLLGKVAERGTYRG